MIALFNTTDLEDAVRNHIQYMHSCCGRESQAAAELADLKKQANGEIERVRQLVKQNTQFHNSSLKLHANLNDAIELAEETVGYASSYFQEKWRLNERLAELKLKANPKGISDAIIR